MVRISLQSSERITFVHSRSSVYLFLNCLSNSKRSIMPSSSSQPNQQAQVTGSQVDAAVAAASRITSNILTQDAKVHAIIGGQALKLLGNDRRTSVCMKAHQIVFFVTNCYRTWTSWWIDQRLKLEQDCFNWMTDTPSILLTNWVSKRSVNELSHKGFINSFKGQQHLYRSRVASRWTRYVDGAAWSRFSTKGFSGLR